MPLYSLAKPEMITGVKSFSLLYCAKESEANFERGLREDRLATGSVNFRYEMKAQVGNEREGFRYRGEKRGLKFNVLFQWFFS